MKPRRARLTPILTAEIPRRRLLDVLASSVAQVVVLNAPSGYGKTTLLAQLIHSRPEPYIWLTLSEEHGDFRQLASLLASELQQTHEVDLTNDELLSASPGRCARMLTEGLNALEDNLWLVFDRTEHLTPESGAFLAKLIEQLGEGHRVLLAGYTDNGLPLSIWLARERAMVLPMEELAFSYEETTAYLQQRQFAGDPTEVHASQEGWPAGIAMVAAGARANFKTPDLVKEVLDRLPQPLRSTLPEAAVVEEWSEERVQDLGICLGAGWLKTAVGLGLPIASLGAGQYRPHKLLLDTLEAELRLSPQRHTVLHQVAAHKALERGHSFVALRHLIKARAETEALQLAERMAHHYHQRWAFPLVRQVLEQFKLETLPPMLQALLGNAMTETKASVQGEQLLRSLLENPEVAAWAHCSLARIAAFQGNHAQQLELVQKSIALSKYSSQWSNQLLALGWALGELGRYKEAAKAVEEQVAWGKQHNQPLEVAGGLSLLAGIYAAMGRPQEAEQASRQSIRIFEELNLSTRAVFEQSNLSSSLMLRGQLDEAWALLDQSLQMVAEEGHVLESRIRHSLGDWHMLRGEYPEALGAYQLALHSCGGQPLDAKAQEIRLQICDVARILGRADRVQHHLGRARELADRSDTLTNRYWLEFQEGLEEFYAGRLGAAEEHLQQIKESYEVFLLPRVLAYRAEIARRLGRLKRTQVDEWVEKLEGLGGDQVLRIDAPVLQALYQTCVAKGWHPERFQPWLNPQPSTPATAGQKHLELKLLGKPKVFYNHQPLKIPLSKSMELLALLALRGPSSREQILDALWEGSADSEDGRYFKVALRQLRMALRQVMGVSLDPIPFQDGLYHLSADLTLEVDTWLISGALSTHDAPALQAALRIYKGPFMQGFDSEWAAETRKALTDEAIAAVLHLGQMLEKDNPSTAIEVYRWGLEIDPMAGTVMNAMDQAYGKLGDFAGRQWVQRLRQRAFA